MVLKLGLTVAALVLLGTGVYLAYSQFVAHSGPTNTWLVVATVIFLLGGAVLGARVAKMSL